MSSNLLRTVALLVALACCLGACGQRTKITEEPVSEPASKESESTEALATLGGGCFWCTEAVFRELKGVLAVESGYSGGGRETPTYEEVSSGLTDHAEAAQVRYDPSVVTFAQILEVFFATHDPTTLNRQGADFGRHYRSVIFVHDAEQRKTAETIIAALEKSGAYDDPIVTEIADFEAWFPAEDYHQDYYENNPGAGYCRAVIAPKLEKFRKVFADRLKSGE